MIAARALDFYAAGLAPVAFESEPQKKIPEDEAEALPASREQLSEVPQPFLEQAQPPAGAGGRACPQASFFWPSGPEAMQILIARATSSTIFESRSGSLIWEEPKSNPLPLKSANIGSIPHLSW